MYIVHLYKSNLTHYCTKANSMFLPLVTDGMDVNTIWVYVHRLPAREHLARMLNWLNWVLTWRKSTNHTGHLNPWTSNGFLGILSYNLVDQKFASVYACARVCMCVWVCVCCMCVYMIIHLYNECIKQIILALIIKLKRLVWLVESNKAGLIMPNIQPQSRSACTHVYLAIHTHLAYT